MEDEQFDKLMAVNRETQSMQREQGDTLRGFAGELHGLTEESKKQSETLNGLGRDLAKLETNVDNLKERAKEDREVDGNRSDRMEDKLGKVHDRVNDVPKLRGEFENHIDDNHATKSAETEKALEEHTKDGHAKVAHETRSDLDDHMIDNNRHSGEAPGGGGAVKTGATVAGGVTVGGGIIWGVVELVKMFS